MKIRKLFPTQSSLAATLAVLAAFLIQFAAPSAFATQYTWIKNATGSQTWTTTANWSPTTVFLTGTGNELRFFADITTPLLNGGNSIDTSVPTTLSMNILTLNGKGAAATAAAAITLATSASTWTLGGSSPTVNLNGVNGTQPLNYTVAANITLGANTTFTGNGTAGFTFSGAISGSSMDITKTGTSILTLSGANSGTLVGGNAYVNAGTLLLSLGAGTALGGSGGPTIQLGDTSGSATATLQSGVSSTIANSITVRAGSSGLKTIGVNSGSATVYSGIITANDDVTFLSFLSTSSSFTVNNSSGSSTIAANKTVTFSNLGNTTGSGNSMIETAIWGGPGKIAYTGANAGSILIASQKTYSGGATLNAMSGAGAITVRNNSTPTSGTLTSGPFGTGTLTINTTQLRADAVADVTLGNAITFGGNPTFTTFAGEKSLILTGNADLGSSTRTFNSAVGTTVAGKTVDFQGIISGTGSAGIIKTGAGTLKLSGGNTYPGNTAINAGTLALSVSGSIANSPVISIAASATLDVSGITPTSFTITGASPVQTLAGSSATGTAAINATGKSLTLASGALATFQAAGGGSTTVGKISVTGNLTLNANAVTVNVTGAALAAGTYRLLDCTGTLANTGTFGTPTISGTALASGYTASISVTTGVAGHVDLVVKATPAFSGLTASQSINFGTASVTLSGTVSAAGPVYPANGETVNVTINGNTQPATISGGVGGFSVSFPTAAIPYSASPYTITYAYAGNATTLNAATSDTSTALTVNKATPTITGVTVSQSISYGTASVTLSGTVSAGAGYPANGETVNVTINGNTQPATISGGVGGFSVSFPTATILPSPSAYTITYAYAGDANLNAAANNVGTALTVTGVKAPALSYANATGTSRQITLSEIQAAGLASSQSSPTYTISLPSASSTLGGNVVTDGSKILYEPSSTPGSDSFSYTVSDGVASGTATVSITFTNAVSVSNPEITVTGGVVNGTMYGIPGVQYDVQRSTTANGTYTTLTADLTPANPITAGSDGKISFQDTAPPSGSGFYRTIQH